jgi:hypothetical protein
MAINHPPSTLSPAIRRQVIPAMQYRRSARRQGSPALARSLLMRLWRAM